MSNLTDTTTNAQPTGAEDAASQDEAVFVGEQPAAAQKSNVVRMPKAKSRQSHYEVRHDEVEPGVYWCPVEKDPDGKAKPGKPVWICSPLRVVAETRDLSEADANENWGRLLRFVDDDGVKHQIVAPQDTHTKKAADELLSTLLRAGARITMVRSKQWMVSDYIQQQRMDRRARTTHHTGWHRDSYVFLDHCTGQSKEPLVYQPAVGTSVGTAHLGQRGTLDAWVKEVAAPAAGNSRLALAISCAFGGAVLGLLDAPGAIIHLLGDSGIGKSTSSYCAASAYGVPDVHSEDAYTRTWRATDNSLELTAATHTDKLLVLDELGLLDPKKAGSVAYLLPSGQGKGRMSRGAGQRPADAWRVLTLSNGEVSIQDLITVSGQRVQGGQEVRVLDVPADAGKGTGVFERVPDGMTPGQFADSLQRAATHNYGLAFPAFIDALAKDPDKYRRALRELIDVILAEIVPQGAHPQVARAGKVFALVAAAGELATTLGLTGWTTGEAKSAAATCFRAWLAHRPAGKGDAELNSALRQVRGFLSAHADDRFEPWEPNEDHPVRARDRVGFVKEPERHADPEEQGPTYYVEREAWARDVCTGFDPKRVAHMLADHHAMRTEGNCVTCSASTPDGRKTRMYIVTPGVWNDANFPEINHD